MEGHDVITRHCRRHFEVKDLCWCETEEQEARAQVTSGCNTRIYLNLALPLVFPPMLLPYVPREEIEKNFHYYTSGIFPVSELNNRSSFLPFYLKKRNEVYTTKQSKLYRCDLIINGISYPDVVLMKETLVKVSFVAEFMIGYHSLNELRKEIPNFVLTYGYFAIDKKPYIALENVPSNMLLESIVLPGDLCLYFLQVYLSLVMANREFGFTHYDMHRGNVVLTVSRRESITYRYRSENVTLVSPFRATIIDFGRSRAMVQGQIVGSMDNVTSIVTNKKTNMLVDFYRLFMSSCLCFHDNPETPSETLEFLQEIYSIFGGGNLRQALDDQEKYFYYYDACNRESFCDPVDPVELADLSPDTSGASQIEETLDGDTICHNVIAYLMTKRKIYDAEVTYSYPNVVDVNSFDLRRQPTLTTLAQYFEIPQHSRRPTSRDIDNILRDAQLHVHDDKLERFVRNFYMAHPAYIAAFSSRT